MEKKEEKIFRDIVKILEQDVPQEALAEGNPTPEQEAIALIKQELDKAREEMRINMYPKDPREIVPELIKRYNFQTRRVENILLNLRLREVIGASCESKEREDLLIHEILHKLPNVVSTTVNGVTIDDLKEKFIKKNGRLDKKGLIKFLSSLKPYMAFLDENYKVVPSSKAYFN